MALMAASEPLWMAAPGKKASFSASLCQQKHCPQPSEGQPPDRRGCVRCRSPPAPERWWNPRAGILHGDLYWNRAASIPRVHRATLYANLSPDGDKHIRLSILLLFGSRYSALELLSGSLKVMESFHGLKRQKNRAGLSSCIDFKRLSCRIRVFLSDDNYEDPKKAFSFNCAHFSRPRGSRKPSHPPQDALQDGAHAYCMKMRPENATSACRERLG